MRDFQQPGRSANYAEIGMVATAHPESSLIGLDVLREGGTAVDAAIAAHAALAVIEPHSTGIGGDCFAIMSGADGAIKAFNGSGRTPKALTPDKLAAAGVAKLTPEIAHVVTVPGAVDAWCQLHAAYGRLPLERLFRPAIRLANEGYRVHPRVAHDWARCVGRVSHHAPARAAFLAGGTAPVAGDKRALPALGHTLARIAADGPKAFYEAAAASIVPTLRALGGLHELSDFADHRGEWVEPIRTTYRGLEVLECPPNGQGVTALVMLNALARFDVAGLPEVDRIHLFAEICKLAYAERNSLIADPAFAEVPVTRLLSPGFAAELAGQVRMDRAAGFPPAMLGMHTDTTYLCAVDRDRNAISMINSLFNGFGSGIFDARSGVMLQNRGFGFVMIDGHPNQIGPAKRPMHTIIPGFAVEDGRPVMPFGVMGGQFQANGHAWLISRMVDQGLDPQEAIEAPRSFCYGGHLQLETTIPDATAAALAARGHEIVRATGALGGAQAIRIDHARGVLIGGSESRKDGMALGY